MCAYVYPHTLNIDVLWLYKDWNRYSVEMQIWRPPHSQNVRRHEKNLEAVRESLNLLHPKDTNCLFCLFSFFLRKKMAEEKLQRSRKVPESAGKKTTCWSWGICWDNRFIIQQVFTLCLPCNVAREEFSISMCEILSPALSPSCTKPLVTKRKLALSQLCQSFSSLVSSWSSSFNGALPERGWQHGPWAHSLGEGSVSVNTSVLGSVCSYHVLSISRRNRNNDQGIEAFLSEADLLVHLAHRKLLVLLLLLNTVYVVLPK